MKKYKGAIMSLALVACITTSVFATTSGNTSIDAKPLITSTAPSQPASEDEWGNTIRTTNLPSNSALFPYIREEIPNWAYEAVSKSMNNNAWGAVNRTTYPGYRKMQTSPVDLWNKPNYGSEMWNKTIPESQIPSMKKDVKYKTLVMTTLHKFYNIDYKTLKDTSSSQQANLAGFMISPIGNTPAINGIIDTKATRTKFKNYAGGKLDNAVEHKSVLKSDKLVPLWECAWQMNWTDGLEQLVLPVYVELDMSTTGQDLFNAYLGLPPYTLNEKDLQDSLANQQNVKLKGIINIGLIKGKYFHELNYNTMNPVSQLHPQLNTFEGLDPSYPIEGPTAKYFSYDWNPRTSEGALMMTRYQDYDLKYAQKDEENMSSLWEQFKLDPKTYTYEDIADNGAIDNPQPAPEILGTFLKGDY